MFNREAIYPRRYFDDLVIENQMHTQKIKLEESLGHAGANTLDAYKMREMLQNPKVLPFNDVSGRKPFDM